MGTTIIFLFVLCLATMFTTLAGAGAAFIVTKSYLFRPLQRLYDPAYSEHGADIRPKLNKLFNCPACAGTWFGFLFQFLMLVLVRTMMNVHPLFYWVDLIIIFFQGCITSIVSMFVYLTLKKLGYE